jgi:hypothetical protein
MLHRYCRLALGREPALTASLGLLASIAIAGCKVEFHAALPAHRADAGKATTTCTRHLQAIGRALVLYRHATGQLPAHLSDLYPRYLSDKRLLHCPADPTSGEPGIETVNAAENRGRVAVPTDPRLPVSYLYEMTLARNPAGNLLGPVPVSEPATWREFKTAQRVFFDDRVPVVRCWHHLQETVPSGKPLVLNLTLTGQVYRSEPDWEWDPGTVPVVLAAMERDLAAGPAQFRRHWWADRVGQYFADAPPVPALRGRYRSVAARLATLAKSDPTMETRGTARAIESLRRAAGD